MSRSSPFRRSLYSFAKLCRWSGNSDVMWLAEDKLSSSISPSLTCKTGWQVATSVPLYSVCGSPLKLITLNGSVSWAGFRTTRATTTLPSHKGLSWPSTIPCVRWDDTHVSPGIIISLMGGTLIVSATLTRNTCGITSMERQECTMPPTVRDSSFILKVHWYLRRKSMPITTGSSISATTITFDHMSLPVPSCQSNCTVPKEPVKLPSAKRSLPVSLFRGISESSDNIANTDGCTTVTVDPVSINPITDTPLTNKGRYKLPVASVSSSTVSWFGPNICLAAGTWASVAATPRFPSQPVASLTKPGQSHHVKLYHHLCQKMSVAQLMSFDLDIHGSNGLQHHSDDTYLASASLSWQAYHHWHHDLYQLVWCNHLTVSQSLQTNHKPMMEFPSLNHLAVATELMEHLCSEQLETSQSLRLPFQPNPDFVAPSDKQRALEPHCSTPIWSWKSPYSSLFVHLWLDMPFKPDGWSPAEAPGSIHSFYVYGCVAGSGRCPTDPLVQISELVCWLERWSSTAVQASCLPVPHGHCLRG